MKTQRKSKNWKWHVTMLFLVLGLAGCKSDDKEEVKASYDPSQPVKITKFTPESGAGGSQFLVYGSNFGTDVSKIKVTVNDKPAVVITSDGSCIYCMVPPKAGVGAIKVTVGEESQAQEVVAEQNFEYIPSFVLKTLTGHRDAEGRTATKDGSFEEAQFEYPYWLLMDDEYTLYLIQAQRGLRKLDLKNRTVTTLWGNGNGMTQPRAIAFTPDHSKMYIFNDQDRGDVGVAVAERRTDGKEDFSSWSTVYLQNSCCGGAIHPSTGDMFFNKWNGGEYFKWNPEKRDTELIFRMDNGFNSILQFAPSGKFAYITTISHHCVYRSNFDFTTGRLLAPYILCGRKGEGGYEDGPGSKARFNQPQQGCFDEDDNFYVCDQNNNLVRKVEPSGQVTTFAGRAQGDWGWADGDLRKDARFDRPHGIAYNPHTGEFYIADQNNHRIRIITKE